jgi:translation initiation factor 2-alpha kinase 4
MIFDLATRLRDVLEESVQLRYKNEHIPSLEEERILKEAAALEAEEARKSELERQMIEASREEEQMLKQMMLDELNRQRKKLDASKPEDGFDSGDEQLLDKDVEDSVVKMLFDQRTEVKDDGGNVISFRAVVNLSKLRQGPVTETCMARPIQQRVDATPCKLVLKRVSFSHSAYKEKELRNDIFQLEKELEVLRQLRANFHANILDVLNYRIDKQAAARGESAASWTVTILSPYADKGSLEDLLEIVGCLGEAKLRSWGIQLLEALEFYHCNGVVHGTLHPGNVLFARSLSGATTVKLADGGYQRRLHDMHAKSRAVSDHLIARSAFWRAPELAKDGPGRYTRKTDVWDFGVLFLQMALGTAILEQYTSPTAWLDATDLSPSAEDFIRKMFRLEARKRPSAFELLASEFLRNDESLHAVPPTGASDSRLSSSVSFAPLTLARPRHDSMPSRISSLRYANEFHELERLGKGGFGEVFKARNKLDGQLYAIKKILQNSQGSLSSILSETMLLSKLNHPNVVRYFATWLEEDPFGWSVTDEDAVSFESSHPPTNGPTIEFGHSTGALDIISSAAAPQIEFSYDSEDSDGDSDDEEDEDDGELANQPFDGTDEADAPDGPHMVNGAQVADPGDAGHVRPSLAHLRARSTKAVLYIQMEYCENHVSVSL